MLSPFALIEDLETGTARLFEDPQEVFAPRDHADVPAALKRLESLRREGGKLAGWLGYEAGFALDPRLAPLRGHSAGPLMWMAAFDRATAMPIAAVDGWLAQRSSGSGSLGPMEPLTDRTAYLKRFDRIIEAIRAGDIYQANLTIALGGGWRGDPVAIYRAIRPRAAARFGALVFDGAQWLLSFSPELFFRANGAAIETRPMKGTRPRGRDQAADRALKADLAASRKDRAENLMITDLMRNDLSRLAVPGSVRVDEPFRIEAYPTVFQMTSTVRATLANGFDAAEVLGAMFPCGSITGAPKLRAMEIIDAVEGWRRGPYCGAIGQMDADGACFNVAIRTLRLTPDGRATFGVGSGVVADSDGDGEWRECLSKARFLSEVISPD
ncbi:aminodeoxychorismate synthase component I [Croceicoccus marinus]|jgi:aminodeoxychorismate synthase component I|uniref:Aminodeoxychorismate synthase component I n=1 Tax=Croceicoccus marinus TaxID=450378 RepID=A0A7G6VSU1_9SPHN|nr:aminodeoxychorismate synthase component I [Croceicoccus marinus]QNE04806.1 aminodeoxychorismate synthase component I [Croceicoccus marinus]